MNPLRADEFVSRTLPPAYALALRLTGNESDAWDLTQDAMTKALRALPRFRGASSWGTWMHQIVVNTWKDDRVSLRRRFQSRLLPIDDARVPSPLSRPEDILEGRERSTELMDALASLPKSEREVLALRELEGLRYAEIARRLRVPVGTVKSRFSRARRTLKILLETALIAALVLA